MKKNKSRYINISALVLSALAMTTGTGIMAQNETAEIKKAEILSPKLEILLKAALSKPFTESISIRLKNAWLEDSGLEALDIYLEKLTEDKTDTDKAARACALLAMISESEGYDKRAIELFSKALELKKDWTEAMGAYASLLIRTAHYEDAAAMLEKALEMDSSEENKLKLGKDLGRAFAKSGKTKKAVEIWKKCAKSNADDFEAAEEILDLEIDEGILDEADRFCEELAGKAPSEFKKVSLMVKRAEIRKNRRDLSGAVDSYYAALEKVSSGSWLEKDILRNLEKCSESLGKIKELLAKYDKFMEQNPARIEVARSKARLLMDSGDTEKAIAALSDLVKKMPSDRPVKDLLCDALESASRNDEALSLLNEMSKQSASDSEVMMRKAALEHKMKLDAECAKSVDEYIKRAKDSELSMTRAAKYLRSIGLRKEAEDVFRRMQNTYPKSVEATESYAEYLRGEGRDDEAVSLLEKAASDAELEGVLRISSALSNMKKQDVALKIMKSRDGDFGKQFKYADELSRVYELNGDSDNAAKHALDLMKLAVEGNEFDLAARRVLAVMKKAGKMADYKDSLMKKDKLSEPEYCLLLEMLRSSPENTERKNAVGTADKALEQYPKSAALLEFKLKLCRSAKDNAGIKDCVIKLMALQPSKASWGCRELANMAYDEGNFPEAMSWLEKWRRLNPNLRDVPLLEAKIILAEKADTLRAKDILLRAWAKFPDDREIPRTLVQIMDSMSDSDGIISVLWRLYDMAPDAGAKTGIIRDLVLYTQRIPVRSAGENQYSGIIARLRARMEADQKNPIYPLSLAEVFKVMGYTDQRRSMLIKAGELKGDLIPTLLELSRMDEESGDYEGAIENLKKACELDKTVSSKTKLADFYIKTGADEDAMPILREIILSSGSSSKVMDAAVSLLASRNAEYTIRLLKEYLEKNPDDTAVMYLYGSILMQRSETVDRGLEVFKELAVLEDPQEKAQKSGDDSMIGGLNAGGMYSYRGYAGSRSIYNYSGADSSEYLLKGASAPLARREKDEITEITRLPSLISNITANKSNWGMLPGIVNIINNHGYYSGYMHGMSYSLKNILPATAAETRMMATAALSAYGMEKDENWKKETLEFLKSKNTAYAELKFRPSSKDGNPYMMIPAKEIEDMRKKSPDDKVLKVIWGISAASDPKMTKEDGEAAYRELRDQYPRLALLIAHRFGLGGGNAVPSHMIQPSPATANPFRDIEEDSGKKPEAAKIDIAKETALFKDILQLADKVMDEDEKEAAESKKTVPSAFMNASSVGRFTFYGNMPYPYSSILGILVVNDYPAEIKALALEAVNKKFSGNITQNNAAWYQETAGCLVAMKLNEKKYSDFIDILFANLSKLGRAQALIAEEQTKSVGMKKVPAAGEESGKDSSGCMLPLSGTGNIYYPGQMHYSNRIYYPGQVYYSGGYYGMGGSSYIDVFRIGYMFFNNMGNGYMPQLLNFFPPSQFPVDGELMPARVLPNIDKLRKEASSEIVSAEVELNTVATFNATVKEKETDKLSGTAGADVEKEAIWKAALEKKLPDEKLLVLAVMCGKEDEIRRIMTGYASVDLDMADGAAKRFNAAAYLMSKEEYYKAAKLISEIMNGGKITRKDKIICAWTILYCNAMENIDRSTLTAKQPRVSVPATPVPPAGAVKAAQQKPEGKKGTPVVSKLTEEEKKDLKSMASAGAAYLKSFVTVTDQKRNLIMVLAASGMKDEAQSLFKEVADETAALGARMGNMNLAWIPPAPPNKQTEVHQMLNDANNSNNKQEIAKATAKMVSQNLRQNLRNRYNIFMTDINTENFKWQMDTLKNKKCIDEFLAAMKPDAEEKNAIRHSEYAFALELAGKDQDAIAEYMKILEKYKNNTFAISRLMDLYSEKDTAKALMYAKMLMKGVDPANIQIYYVSTIRDIALYLTIMEILTDAIPDKAEITNYNLQSQMQQMFTMLEAAKTSRDNKTSIPAMFTPGTKTSAKGYSAALDNRRSEVYLKLCGKALKIPMTAEMGFSSEFAYLSAKTPPQEQSALERKMYDKGLELLKAMPDPAESPFGRVVFSNYGNLSSKKDKVMTEFIAEYAFKNGHEAELRAMIEAFSEGKKSRIGYEILWLLDFIKAVNTLDADGIKKEMLSRLKPLDQKKVRSADYMARYSLNQKTTGFMMKYAAQVVSERKLDLDIGKIAIISMLDNAQGGGTHQAMQAAGRYIMDLAESGNMAGVQAFGEELIDILNRKTADAEKDKSSGYAQGNPQDVYFAPFVSMVYTLCNTKAKAVPAMIALYRTKGEDIPERYRDQMLNNMMQFTYNSGSISAWAEILESTGVLNDADTFDPVQVGKKGIRNSLLKQATNYYNDEMRQSITQYISQKKIKTFGSEIVLALISNKDRSNEVAKVLNAYLPKIMETPEAQRRKIFSSVMMCLNYGNDPTENFINNNSRNYPELCAAIKETARSSDAERYEEIMSLKSISNNSNIWELNQSLSGLVNSLLRNDKEKAMKLLAHLRELYDDYGLRNPWNTGTSYYNQMLFNTLHTADDFAVYTMMLDALASPEKTNDYTRNQDNLANSLSHTFNLICSRKLGALVTNTSDMNAERNAIFKETVMAAAKAFGDKLPTAVYAEMTGLGMQNISPDAKLALQLSEDLRKMDKAEPNPIIRCAAVLAERKAQSLNQSEDMPLMSEELLSLMKDIMNDPKSGSSVKLNTLSYCSFVFNKDKADPRLSDIIDSLNTFYRESLVQNGRAMEMQIYAPGYQIMMSLMGANGPVIGKEKLKAMSSPYILAYIKNMRQKRYGISTIDTIKILYASDDQETLRNIMKEDVNLDDSFVPVFVVLLNSGNREQASDFTGNILLRAAVNPQPQNGLSQDGMKVLEDMIASCTENEKERQFTFRVLKERITLKGKGVSHDEKLAEELISAQFKDKLLKLKLTDIVMGCEKCAPAFKPELLAELFQGYTPEEIFSVANISNGKLGNTYCETVRKMLADGKYREYAELREKIAKIMEAPDKDNVMPALRMNCQSFSNRISSFEEEMFQPGKRDAAVKSIELALAGRIIEARLSMIEKGAYRDAELSRYLKICAMENRLDDFAKYMNERDPGRKQNEKNPVAKFNLQFGDFMLADCVEKPDAPAPQGTDADDIPLLMKAYIRLYEWKDLGKYVQNDRDAAKSAIISNITALYGTSEFMKYSIPPKKLSEIVDTCRSQNTFPFGCYINDKFKNVNWQSDAGRQLYKSIIEKVFSADRNFHPSLLHTLDYADRIYSASGLDSYIDSFAVPDYVREIMRVNAYKAIPKNKDGSFTPDAASAIQSAMGRLLKSDAPDIIKLEALRRITYMPPLFKYSAEFTEILFRLKDELQKPDADKLMGLYQRNLCIYILGNRQPEDTEAWKLCALRMSDYISKTKTADKQLISALLDMYLRTDRMNDAKELVARHSMLDIADAYMFIMLDGSRELMTELMKRPGYNRNMNIVLYNHELFKDSSDSIWNKAQEFSAGLDENQKGIILAAATRVAMNTGTVSDEAKKQIAAFFDEVRKSKTVNPEVKGLIINSLNQYENVLKVKKAEPQKTDKK